MVDGIHNHVAFFQATQDDFWKFMKEFFHFFLAANHFSSPDRVDRLEIL